MFARARRRNHAISLARRYVAQRSRLNLRGLTVNPREMQQALRIVILCLIVHHLRMTLPLAVSVKILLARSQNFIGGRRLLKRRLRLIVLADDGPMALLRIARVDLALGILYPLHHLSIIPISLLVLSKLTRLPSLCVAGAEADALARQKERIHRKVVHCPSSWRYLLVMRQLLSFFYPRKKLLVLE